MAYSVKEIFYTLQGEGAQAGRAAVFCRFSGCNLWSGREEDRSSSQCRFCDTDFVGTDGIGGGKFATAEELSAAVSAVWPQGTDGRKYVVLTGGEPLLQLDAELIKHLHLSGFEIAVESNGSLEAPDGIDWLTVSPKAGVRLRQLHGDELKVVYPQADMDPADFEALAFRHFFVQPKDDVAKAENTRAAVAYCMAHPRWRLSLQSHKVLGIA